MSGAEGLAARQRAYFLTGATLPFEKRRGDLERLGDAVRTHEDTLLAALRADLHKTPAEGYMTEVGMVLEELKFARRHLRGWMRPRRAPRRWRSSRRAASPSRSLTVRRSSSRPGTIPCSSAWRR